MSLVPRPFSNNATPVSFGGFPVTRKLVLMLHCSLFKVPMALRLQKQCTYPNASYFTAKKCCRPPRLPENGAGRLSRRTAATALHLCETRCLRSTAKPSAADDRDACDVSSTVSCRLGRSWLRWHLRGWIVWFRRRINQWLLHPRGQRQKNQLQCQSARPMTMFEPATEVGWSSHLTRLVRLFLSHHLSAPRCREGNPRSP